MKAETFDRFCAFLEQHSGILLSRDKQYLVETRLSRVARSKGYSTVESLIETLLSRRDRMLARDVVDAMTTNETLWFRDGYPFAALEKKFFPEAVAAKKATYRVWSAACSTGQEAFSISIIAEEQRVPFNLEIVGTDISEAVVEKARRGVFDDLSLGRGLSPERKRQFFVKATDGWKVAPQISRRTQFRVGNLLELRPEARRYDWCSVATCSSTSRGTPSEDHRSYRRYPGARRLPDPRRLGVAYPTLRPFHPRASAHRRHRLPTQELIPVGFLGCSPHPLSSLGFKNWHAYRISPRH